jgi:hypothetical protein
LPFRCYRSIKKARHPETPGLQEACMRRMASPRWQRITTSGNRRRDCGIVEVPGLLPARKHCKGLFGFGCFSTTLSGCVIERRVFARKGSRRFGNYFAPRLLCCLC